MNDYISKIRVNKLSNSEKRFIASKIPNKVEYTHHFAKRLNERKIFITKGKINKALTIDNLIDIQVASDCVTYLFKVKLCEHLLMLFVVGENGKILTAWKTTKVRKANNRIYTDDLSGYKKIVC